MPGPMAMPGGGIGYGLDLRSVPPEAGNYLQRQRDPFIIVDTAWRAGLRAEEWDGGALAQRRLPPRFPCARRIVDAPRGTPTSKNISACRHARIGGGKKFCISS